MGSILTLNVRKVRDLAQEFHQVYTDPLDVIIAMARQLGKACVIYNSMVNDLVNQAMVLTFSMQIQVANQYLVRYFVALVILILVVLWMQVLTMKGISLAFHLRFFVVATYGCQYSFVVIKCMEAFFNQDCKQIVYGYVLL